MMEKELNSICFCGKYLSETEEELLMLFPCEHIIHSSCLNKRYCILCKTNIDKSMRFSEINYLVKRENRMDLYQNLIDLITVKNSEKCDINFLVIPKRITDISHYILNIRDGESSEIIFQNLLQNLNIRIHKKGLDKLTSNKKIFICNHSCYIDPLIIYIIFKCGFLAGSFVRNISLIKKIVKLLPILYIQRGDKKNTVSKIKEFIENIGNICLFPEGLVTHYNTLAQFRTGAFNAGYEVQPLIIKYSPNVHHTDYKKFILRLLSQERIDVELEVLDPYNPPFNKESIAEIRDKMAMRGDLAKSRISNRDIKEL